MSELLLAIESSTRAASVCAALFEHETAQWAGSAQRTLSATAPLTSELVPTIQSAISAVGKKPIDLRVAAFSRGPGSFTGLRAAASVVRMFASTTGCAVVGIPTFEAIAVEAFEWLASPDAPANARLIERVVVLTPAKAGFVFTAEFHRSGLSEHADVFALVPLEIRAIETWRSAIAAPFAVVADARLALPLAGLQGCLAVPTSFATPSAQCIARLALRRYARGAVLRPEEIVPFYGRRPECEEVYDTRRAEARSRRGE